MADSNSIIRQAYSAFNKRDVDGALALMTTNVCWPKASEGGRASGKEEIRSYWNRQWAEFDPYVEPLALTEEGDNRIVVKVHQRVKSLRGDLLSDTEVLHVFTLENGLIRAMALGFDEEVTSPPAFARTESGLSSPRVDLASTHLTNGRAAPWLCVHPCSAKDQAVMMNMRPIVLPNKGKLQGIAARTPFDEIMERVATPEGVVYQRDEIGGIPGWWCRPIAAPSDHVVIHIHGGWFTWGTAAAFRHLAGHIAVHAGATVFLPDYRLSPEHPFPAAIGDVLACFFGLIDRGYLKVAVTGDSAGGNLALGLLAHLAGNKGASSGALVGGVAISPVTDLSLSGETWASRAIADPLFIRPQAFELVEAYLNGHEAQDPVASPLFANLNGLVPIRVHVGDDEVLLADSVRFAETAAAAGVDARLDVWEGMIHGFLGSAGLLDASNQALTMIGEFLRKRFNE